MNSKTNTKEMIFAPVWELQSLPKIDTNIDTNRIFLVSAKQVKLRTHLSSFIPVNRLYSIDSHNAGEILSLAKNISAFHLVFITQTIWYEGCDDDAILIFFRLIKQLTVHPEFSLDVITERSIPCPHFSVTPHPSDAAFIGLTQTLAKELPKQKIRCFALDALNERTIAVATNGNYPVPTGTPIAIVGSQFSFPRMRPTSTETRRSQSSFKRGGTYVIIGGYGGLGRLLAQYLAKSYQAHIVLLSRKQSDQQFMQSLKSLGAIQVTHKNVDIMHADALTEAIESLSTINGVIHSALVLDDATFANMSEDSILKVLGPKLKGSINLANALRHRTIDFILFFSSIQSYIANAGQGNYTAACMSKDAIANFMSNVFMLNTKIINWGFWGSLGIVATDRYRDRMAKLGIHSIEAEEGIDIIEAFLASSSEQITVIKAEEYALKALNIDPYYQPVEGAVKQNPQSLMPVYNACHPLVLTNEEAMFHLDAYACSEIHRIGVPSDFKPRFDKLVTAIKAMPKKDSLTRDEILLKFPQVTGHINLIDTCIISYHDILCGRKNPLEVLFPGGSVQLVQQVYADNSIAEYFNSIAADVIANYCNAHPDKHIRILEVGAGTGSTTKLVLPHLQGKNTSYTFSDLSHSFLKRARQLFAHFAFVDYQIVDISNPPRNLEPFDIIVATNVIHATDDLNRSVSNIAKLLTTGGIFVLNEITSLQNFATLTFGLTDGWWLNSGEYRIPNSPLLSVSAWKSLLSKNGFEKIIGHGSEDQQVFLGEKREDKTPIQHSKNELTIEDVKSYVVSIVCDVMQLDQNTVDTKAPFGDYGIDSLIAIELLTPFRDDLGYIPATALFEYPSVHLLAEYFLTEFRDILTNLLGTKINSPHVVIDDPMPQPELIVEQNQNTVRASDIAVIGMAGQLPAAHNLSEFWANLVDGRTSYTDVPHERWHQDSFIQPDSPLNGGSYTKKGAFIDDIACFDNDFFKITPHDATRMDPQERLFLQTTYHVLQNAGYSIESLKGSQTAVFVGVMNGAYAWHTPKDNKPKSTSLFWSIANRTSYFYDWKGPSMAVDSACSSSLTAVHLACQALLTGDCQQAIVGGVNLIVHPQQYDLLCSMHMLSRSEVCKPFGADADGFVDGEGICGVMLKKLTDAIADGDIVHAVISGTAVNSGGQSNGYTAPDARAQAVLVDKALERAQVDAKDVSYIEAHGTGTALGDPIEIAGLRRAFTGVEKQSIAIGSVKSNIGHLESAAGLSGLLKTILQLKHQTLVPSLHAENENQHLTLADTPFYVQKKLAPWKTTRRRIAGISSFGAGGANAHVIVKEFTESDETKIETRPALIVLSHQTASGLQRQIDALRVFLCKENIDLESLAATLGRGRDHFGQRIAFVASNIEDLRRQLDQDLNDWISANKRQISSSTEDLSQAIATKNLSRLKEMYCAGSNLPWSTLFQGVRQTEAPEYHFTKNHFWVDSKEANFNSKDGIIEDHVIRKQKLIPAAWYISEVVQQSRSYHLSDITWNKGVRNRKDINAEITTTTFTFIDRSSGHTVCKGAQEATGSMPEFFYQAIPNSNFLAQNDIYQFFSDKGYSYGPSLAVLQWAKYQPGVVKGYIDASQNSKYFLSPALIDGGLQTAILMPELQKYSTPNSALVPFMAEEIKISSINKKDAIYCYCVLDKEWMLEKSVRCDFYFTNENGQVLIYIKGLQSVVTNLIEPTPLVAPKRKAFSVYDLREGSYL